MATLFGLHPFLLKLYADRGDQGPQFKAARQRVLGQVSLEIVKRSDAAKTFTVLPKRWIVERIPAFAGTGSSVGLTAAAGWPRIGNALTPKHWRSCAGLRSGLCSESLAEQQNHPGQTLGYLEKPPVQG